MCIFVWCWFLDQCTVSYLSLSLDPSLMPAFVFGSHFMFTPSFHVEVYLCVKEIHVFESTLGWRTGFTSAGCVWVNISVCLATTPTKHVQTLSRHHTETSAMTSLHSLWFYFTSLIQMLQSNRDCQMNICSSFICSAATTHCYCIREDKALIILHSALESAE